MAYTWEGKTHEVLPDFLTDLSPDRSIGLALEKEIHGKGSQTERFTRELQELKAEVDVLKRKLGEAEEPKKAGRKGGSTEKEG